MDANDRLGTTGLESIGQSHIAAAPAEPIESHANGEALKEEIEDHATGPEAPGSHKQEEPIAASLPRESQKKEDNRTGTVEGATKAPVAPSDAEIKDELLKYLQEDSFTMDVTERQLRGRLEKHFGLPLKDRKGIIRDKIMEFIQAKQDAEDANVKKNKEDAPEEDQEEISEDDVDDQPVKKRKRGSGGLNASCRLSEPLQAFLGVETMSRPQVVKALWEYIKGNELQAPSNKRKIIVDDKLATLFTKPLDMFSMNRQLSKHVKTNDGPAPAASDDGDESDDDDESDSPTAKKQAKSKAGRKAPAEKSAKKARTSKADGSAKKPSAFTRPLKVSPELSEWLGGETEISRPQLTKRFWAYAKEKNLLDPKNKKMVICDQALKKLTGEDSFQCFGFAKYTKQHLLGFADEQ